MVRRLNPQLKINNWNYAVNPQIKHWRNAYFILLQFWRNEIDFLLSQGAKISAIEVKSSGTGKHESLTEFSKKYSKHIKESIILSQKDISKDGTIKYIPIYLTSILCK